MRTTIHDERYKKHKVFELLDQYASFYDSLALSVMGWIPMGVQGALSIDTYVYGSMKENLWSIKELLIKGRIPDAYTLLRKYYDTVVINIYADLYLDDHFSINNFVVKHVDDWVKGREKTPDFQAYG